MRHFFQRADAILRGEDDGFSLGRSVRYCVVFGLIYGAAMGCFSGLGMERWQQIF